MLLTVVDDEEKGTYLGKFFHNGHHLVTSKAKPLTMSIQVSTKILYIS